MEIQSNWTESLVQTFLSIKFFFMTIHTIICRSNCNSQESDLKILKPMAVIDDVTAVLEHQSKEKGDSVEFTCETKFQNLS